MTSIERWKIVSGPRTKDVDSPFAFFFAYSCFVMFSFLLFTFTSTPCTYFDLPLQEKVQDGTSERYRRFFKHWCLGTPRSHVSSTITAIATQQYSRRLIMSQASNYWVSFLLFFFSLALGMRVLFHTSTMKQVNRLLVSFFFTYKCRHCRVCWTELISKPA